MELSGTQWASGPQHFAHAVPTFSCLANSSPQQALLPASLQAPVLLHDTHRRCPGRSGPAQWRYSAGTNGMFAGQLFPGAHTRAPDPYRNPKRPQSIPFPEMVGEGPSPWGCKVQPDRNNDCVEAQGRGWGWDRWISARLSLSQGQAEPSALPVGTGFTVLSTGAAKCLPTLALLCFLSPWDLCVQPPATQGKEGLPSPVYR